MENNLIPGPEEYLANLEAVLKKAKSRKQFYEAVVNAPFRDQFQTTVLGLGFLAFLLENKKTGVIDRISISDTDLAQGAIDMTNKAFHDMKVPINYPGNIVATAISTGQHQQTIDWHLLTDPAVSAEESRFNQAAAGIASSVVYPLIKTAPKGAIIFQFYIDMSEIDVAHHNFMKHYTQVVSTALKNQVKKLN